MGEQEEESGRTRLAALTLIEAGEIGGWVVGVGVAIDIHARILYVICNVKMRGGLNNQISIYIYCLLLAQFYIGTPLHNKIRGSLAWDNVRWIFEEF